MHRKNSIYIGTSLDGYIADRNGGLEWLDIVPNPNGDDMGFVEFMNSVDALLMGRTTFETVVGFDVPWPYSKPVYVLSNSLEYIPDSHADKAQLVKGDLIEVLDFIHSNGHYKLYIDGGRTIQSFLKAGLIDEMIIARLPILLGGGSNLFGALPGHLQFDLIKSEVLLGQIVKSHYQKKLQ